MLILPSYYLAPVSYYATLYAEAMRGDHVYVDTRERWEKQTLRSRCYIATPQGRQMLTIPVSHTPLPDSSKPSMGDMFLSDHGNWQHVHWNALVSAYDKSPYFFYYRDAFEPLYAPHSFTRLVDFNTALQNTILDLLDLPLTEEVMTSPAEGVAICHDFSPYAVTSPYYQVFSARTGFLADLSMVDLLFNMGPESRIILRRTVGME